MHAATARWISALVRNLEIELSKATKGNTCSNALVFYACTYQLANWAEKQALQK